MKRAPSTVLMLRFALLLSGIFLVLFGTYQSMTTRRYDSTNDITGEILRKHNFGETFISRYPDLSGIEVRVGTYSTVGGHAPAGLVLHLRDNPDAVSDLATGSVPASEILPDDGWYRFSFPPIHDSQDRPFYFEVESPDGAPDKAVTLFWWRFKSVGNPYNDGAAYSDRVRQHADLTFGLVYSPPPFALFGLMLKDAFSWNLIACLAVLASVALAATAGLFWLRGAGRGSMRTTPSPAHKGMLLVVLSLGLTTGLLNMFLTPPWQGPDEQAHFGYVALLEHHGLDATKVHALQANKDPEDEAFGEAVANSMDRFNFTRLVPGANPGAESRAGDSVWAEVSQPASYYWLCAAVLHVGRLPGVAPDPYTDPADALLWVRGVSVLLNLGVVVLAWIAGVILGGTKFPWLGLLLPLSIVLLPMHAFMAGLANNDIAAEVVCSAMFVALVLLFRSSPGRRAAIWVVLSVALGGAGWLTKDSAFTVLPLLALALIIWFWHFIAQPLLRARLNRTTAYPQPRPLWRQPYWRLVLAAGIVTLVAAAGLLALSGDSTVAGWQVKTRPVERPDRVASPSAHSGRYVLELRPRSKSGIAASQMLIPNLYHPSIQVTFSGWARVASASGSGSDAVIAIVSDGKNLATKGAKLGRPGEWVRISVSATVPEGDRAVLLRLAAYGEGSLVQFDDVALDFNQIPTEHANPLIGYELVNPSFEQQGIGMPSAISGFLPGNARDAVDVLLNPQPFEKTVVWAGFADHEYRSFWGNFGWLAVPLPSVAYWLIGAIVAVALAGLAVRAVRTFGSWTWRSGLALASVVGLALGLTGVFVRQTLIFAWGSYSFPQGRYLFVAIIPIIWLLLTGLRAAYIPSARIVRRVFLPGRAEADNQGKPYVLPWGVWLLCSLLALFFLYCILDLIVPYFYS